MMRVTINEPPWTRYRLLLWLARVTGVARRWEASGETELELRADLRRLGQRLGFKVDVQRDGSLVLEWPAGAAQVVRCDYDAPWIAVDGREP